MSQSSFLSSVDSEPSQVSWFQEMCDGLGIKDEAGWPNQFGEITRAWLDGHHKPIRTLSLFSGGGGLDIAFHDAGFESVLMVEIEPHYVETLKANSQAGRLLAGSTPLCIDIRDFYPDSALEVDFIIGGPPCQTFSAAGRRAAGVAGTNDPRGTLFEEYVRLLKTLQPKGFLFENVYGIVGAQGGAAWKEIQHAFKAAGYTIFSRILDSADYGVPQHRERLIIVGLREGEFLFPYPTHGPDSLGNHPFYTAGEAVSGINIDDAENGLGGQFGHLLHDIPPGLNYSFYTEKMGHPQPVFAWRSKFSDFLYKADPDSPVRTIKAQGGQYTGPFSWENRPFTVAELKRLQTFPDSYEIVGSRLKTIEQIGNSVPPQLGRILALSILDQVMGVSLPFQMNYLPSGKQLGFRQRKRAKTVDYERKAKAALSVREANSPTNGTTKLRRLVGQDDRYLAPNFRWGADGKADDSHIIVRYDLSESHWSIEAEAETNVRSIKYEIVLRSTRNNKWLLPVSEVCLVAWDDNTATFTALWKAFEEKVASVVGVADLVQLRGYYQYAPSFEGRLVFRDGISATGNWAVLHAVVEGNGVGQQRPQAELADILNVPEQELLNSLGFLRRLGYEVRNHNTNRTLPKGEFLIPYAFPTLTPRSVQLHKRLESA